MQHPATLTPAPLVALPTGLAVLLAAAATALGRPEPATPADGPSLTGTPVVLLDGRLAVEEVRLDGFEAALSPGVAGGRVVVRYTDERGVERRRDLSAIRAIVTPSWIITPGRARTRETGLAATTATTGTIISPDGRPLHPDPGENDGDEDPFGAARPPRTIEAIKAEIEKMAAGAPVLGSLELTDGQVLPGRPAPGSPGPDTVLWSLPRFGVVAVPLDEASLLTVSPGGGKGARSIRGAGGVGFRPGARDEVFLTNGDRVSGLIEQVADTVTVSGAQGGAGGAAAVAGGGAGGAGGAGVGGPMSFPLLSVREVRFANPRRGMSGTVVWLADGAAIRVDGLRGEADGQVVLTRNPPGSLATGGGGAAPTVSALFAIDQLLALAPEAEHLVPLSSITPTKQASFTPGGRLTPVRAFDADGGPVVPLGAMDLELPGPMVVEWALPAGAKAAAGWVELPESSWEWGDCVLTATLIGPTGTEREVARERLSADHPGARLDLPVSGAGDEAGVSRLRMTLDPGERGAIQDRVWLRRMMVLK